MHDNKGTTNIFKIEPLKFLDWFIKVCHICLRNCGQEKNQENFMQAGIPLSNEYKKKIPTIYISAFTCIKPLTGKI